MGSAEALDGAPVTDPGECGYGKVMEVKAYTVPDTRKRSDAM